MKRIRSEKLIRTKPGATGAAGFSTVELFALPEAPGHVVHVSTSRDGLQWKETVHTPSPLPLDAATAAFELAVAAQIAQGYVLEGSTADLGTEFTNMIRFQRAYSASSKIITTVDDMLQELSNLKR